jgi:hypothetical protein
VTKLRLRASNRTRHKVVQHVAVQGATKVVSTCDQHVAVQGAMKVVSTCDQHVAVRGVTKVVGTCDQSCWVRPNVNPDNGCAMWSLDSVHE